MRDVTAAAGIAWTHTFGDTHLSSILEDTGSAAAWFDADGDGWLDLYLVNGTHVEGVTGILPDRESPRPGRPALYRNRGGGTFEDVTARAGILFAGYGSGVAVGDVDNDGDGDLLLLNYGPNVLYVNRGDGTFEDATATAGLAGPEAIRGFPTWSVNAVFFDADRDGDLDIHVTNYLAFDPSFRSYYLPQGMPGPDSYLGQEPLFYRNDGKGIFEEVGEEVGVRLPNAKGMGSSAVDFDDDGDLDLFQANDTTANFLFRNDGAGHFTEIARQTGIAYNQSGESSASMHASWGDVNGDGRLDAYIPDLTFSGLFLNHDGQRFEDVTVRAGLAAICGKFSGWGASLEDLDLDGNLDIFLATGKFHHLFGEQELVLLGDGSGGFRDVTAELGPALQEKHVCRGAAFGDYDNDGDVDAVLVVNEVDAPPRLLRNELRGARWLGVEVRPRAGGAEPIGARVSLVAGERTQVREVARSRSFLSSSDPRILFGIPGAERVARLTVRFPGGREVVLRDLAPDRYVIVEEPDEAAP